MKTTNKMIAEFMGHEILYRPYSNGFIEFSDTQLCDVDDLLYHESWDWLMPVVEKIKSTQFRDRDLFSWSYRMYKKSTGTCVFEFYQDGYRAKKVIKAVDFNCMRKATYKAVVEFIKQWIKETL